LLTETARLAFHFHWPLDTLLDLEHRDRRLFLAQAEGLAAAYAGPGAAPSAAGALERGASAPAAAAEPEPEPEPEVAGEPMPAVDLDAIQDERVRKLFETYFPAAS